MKSRHLLIPLAFVVAVLLGYWLASTAALRAPAHAREAPPAMAEWRVIPDEPAPKTRGGGREPGSHRDYAAAIAGALENQRILTFKDQDALAAFLARAGGRIRVLGRIDALHALRVAFSNPDDLLDLLDGGMDSSYVFAVNVPAPKDGTVQQGAVPMGSHLLDFLGVSGDNSAWGRGVRVAVLDTGVTASPAFNTNISAINLVDPPADPSQQNGHGTAVASMIVGSDRLTPGVAPAADILSIRIADDSGISDSFLLAKGIVAAADAGAILINISMGSTGDSGLVRNAIDYAVATGAMIFAAPGNNGLNQVDYPAANAGVIAVGAVDAMGNHLDFSNTGTAIALAAPGYALNAAWTGDQMASVTGTSFSTPIVVGAVAALMSQPGLPPLSAAQAYQLLISYLNDGGAPGVDPALGAGVPDIGRVLNRNTPGIYDAAVASTQILPPDAGNPYGQVEILVQNRGTETLVNTAVQVSTGGGVVTSNITSLAPNAVTTVFLPINRPPAGGGSTISVDASVSLSGGITDSKPSNNHRVETYVPATSP